MFTKKTKAKVHKKENDNIVRCCYVTDTTLPETSNIFLKNSSSKFQLLFNFKKVLRELYVFSCNTTCLGRTFEPIDHTAS